MAFKLLYWHWLVLGMILFSLASWQVASYANTLRSSGEVSETLRMPFYPFTFGVAAACAMITFSLFVDFLSVWASSGEEKK